MGLFDIFKPKPSYTYHPPQRNPYSDMYYKNMEKIEMAWSVLQNLKSFQGDQAVSFENMCRQNIDEFHKMVEFDVNANPDYVIPPHVPAYVRLAMLYEKQERYPDGIGVCVEAIKCGAYSDSSKGKMYGRLSRLIRKSGIKVSDDIIKLTELR